MPNQGRDVFLCYHRDDELAVMELAWRLIAEDVQPWLDEWHLIPGNPRQEEIEAALQQSATCAIFVGPSGIGPWQNEQMRVALDHVDECSSYSIRYC